MKLFEIQEQSDYKSEVNHFIEKVAQDCKSFLYHKEPSQVLYRGMKPSGDFVYDKVVRKDRVPTSTNIGISERIDEYFKKKFGYPFRSQSIFLTSNYPMASVYGEIYSIYPVGDFQFLWSPEVKDLYVKLNALMITEYNIHNRFFDQDYNEGEGKKRKERFLNDLDEIIKDFEYQRTDLSTAIDSRREIMIRVNSYHAIKYKGSLAELKEIDKRIYEELV